MTGRKSQRNQIVVHYIIIPSRLGGCRNTSKPDGLVFCLYKESYLILKNYQGHSCKHDQPSGRTGLENTDTSRPWLPEEATDKVLAGGGSRCKDPEQEGKKRGLFSLSLLRRYRARHPLTRGSKKPPTVPTRQRKQFIRT